MFRVCGFIFFIVFVSGAGMCQDSADRDSIRQLKEEVRQLQQRIADLESRQATQPSTPQQPTSPQATGGDFANDKLVLHDLRGIHWRGFGEVNYKVLDQREPELGIFGFVPGSSGNFYTGDFDLFLTSRIDEKSSVLSEIVFGESEGQTFDVDVERLLLKYDYNDHLKMSFGRYHTGIGYYNTAFHSGKWLQTTADRPLIMEFTAEGGLLPTQAIGISVTGSIPSRSLGLNYLAEYGSGESLRPDIDGSGEVDDQHNGNGINLGLFARPDATPGLEIGGSVYHDKIRHSDFGGQVRVDQTIVNFHVVYVRHGLESLNEGFLIRHALEGTATTFNTPAFYSQLSRRWWHIRPFVRYQYVNASERGVYADVKLRHGPSLGARYEFNNNIAFKAQLDHTIRKDKPNLNGLQMQLAFTF